MAYCMKCGSEMPDGAQFCSQCGQATGRRQVHVGDAIPAVAGAVGKAADKLYETVGGTGHVELRFRDLFSEVFKKHDRRESEEVFICGTATTTPDIRDVQAEWPKPWVWSRALAILLVAVALLFALYVVNENDLALPGLVFMGALAVPFSVLVFFFETNAPRNISLVETVALFFVGGVANLILLYLVPYPDGASASLSVTQDVMHWAGVGLAEEAAKVILIVVVLRLRKAEGPLYILNGMLIGAAVGAGGGMFESAGYIWLYSGTVDDLSYMIVLRGLLSVGTHVAWGAAEGAALALGERVELGQVADPVSLSVFVLKNPAFLAVFASCVVLHAVWNVSLVGPLAFLDDYFIKHAVLVVVIWVVILVLLSRGLDQVNEIASEAAAAGAQGARPAAPTPQTAGGEALAAGAARGDGGDDEPL